MRLRGKRKNIIFGKLLPPIENQTFVKTVAVGASPDELPVAFPIDKQRFNVPEMRRYVA
jgi:hypothetical protein